MTGFIFMNSDAANDYLKVRAPASSSTRRLRCHLWCLTVSSADSAVTGAMYACCHQPDIIFACLTLSAPPRLCASAHARLNPFQRMRVSSHARLIRTHASSHHESVSTMLDNARRTPPVTGATSAAA